MSDPVYIGLDQGSSGSKACVIGVRGEPLTVVSEKVSHSKVAGDFNEQDPQELLESIRSVLNQARQFCARAGAKVEGIGLACQRSGVCAWDRNGQILHPLMTWADRRYQKEVADLGERIAIVERKTGLPVLPNYAAPKIAALQKRFQAEDQFIGTLDTFLVNRLTEGTVFTTEDGMAARTMLYDLKSAEWDDELCKIFDVDKKRLTPITASVEESKGSGDFPLTAMLGDQQAALLSARLSGEQVLLNLGSIASLTVFDDDPDLGGPGFLRGVLLSRPLAGARSRELFVEGVVSTCKAIFDYIAARFGAKSLAEVDQMALEDGDAEPVTAYFAEHGTGSPEWRYGLPCVIDGTLDKRGPVVRGLLENIAHLLKASCEALSVDARIKAGGAGLLVSGGASESNYLMHALSDLLNADVRRSTFKELTARGAALAAASASDKLSIRRDPGGKTFNPGHPHALKERHEKWIAIRNRVYSDDLVGLTILGRGDE